MNVQHVTEHAQKIDARFLFSGPSARQGGTEPEMKTFAVALNCVLADQCETLRRLQAQH